MPVAGVARNPQQLTSFRRFHRLRVLVAGRDQDREVRRTVAEPGTIRRLWRNLAEYAGGPPPFSWTRNGFAPEPPVAAAVSTPLRYMITTRDVLTVGNQLSNPLARPPLDPSVAHTGPRWYLTGNQGYRPTIRSRVPSFGARVPAVGGEIPGGTQ